MKEAFKKIIKEFHEAGLPAHIDRENSLKNSEEIIAIIGLRRVGKTYMMYQKIKELLKEGVNINRIVFIDFEDDRLIGITENDLDKLIEGYYELYPENISKVIYLFFDEIQAAPKWNYFLKRLYEKKQFRIFVSGSSSKLLSQEIATELRGRTLSDRIYPLSFIEFLKFKNFEFDNSTEFSKKRFILKKFLTEFLEYGGYPTIVKCENILDKESLLRNHMELIIYKDLVERYKIRNTFLLKNLIKYFITNSNRVISLNGFYESIKNNMDSSKDSIGEYFSYLEDINFFFVLNRFSYSLKKQNEFSKKIYIADNGFKRIYGFNFMEELGRLLENAIFIELKRREKEIYYYSKKNECDFVIKEGNKITQLIQVCYELNESDREREINGLVEAMEEFNLTEGLLLTFDKEQEIKLKDKKINLMPAWKWLLNLK